VVGQADQVVGIKMKHIKWLGHMKRIDQTMSAMKITDNTQNKTYIILNETKSEPETGISLNKYGDETRVIVKFNLHQHTLH